MLSSSPKILRECYLFPFFLFPKLTKIVNEAMENGTTSQFLLKGLISVIPKKEDSNKVNDLRPITLLEIPRKIITKAMTTRIKKCLSKHLIINENQFCHPGRIIHENIHTLNFLIEREKKEKDNLHAVFLDCSKAFDRVNHEYLCEILKRRGCGNKFLNFIKAFLKGTSKITFKGHLSDDLQVDRGVPQGETLSPFLFILAIDPLLNSIDNDKNIKGVKVSNKNVKVMAYADDLVLIAKSKDDLEKMLVHVRNYEKASNAKLNEKKSQILSFGNSRIDKISEIEQSKERVRHLGIYFDQNGLINNIDEIIEKVEKKLKILKNIFPNFTTRVNIWKGYAISSLLYQSEIITITEKQIEKFEKLEKWFLFKNLSQDLMHIDKNNPIISNVSLNRLELPKKYGGMNLNKIEKIFSAAKSKNIMRSFLPGNENKICYILLKELIEKVYLKQGRNNVNHPLFSVDIRSNKAEKEWKWFKQANNIYHLIDKEITFIPKQGDLILDQYDQKIIFLKYNCEVNKYLPIHRTIPIGLEINTMKDLKRFKSIYKNNPEALETITFDPNDYKNKILKSEHSKWINQENLKFNDFNYEKKLNLRTIFKISIHQKIKPLWTKKQKEWIKKGINLEKIFTTNLKTISKIDDFKRKAFMNYWRFYKKKCKLCGKKFHTFHLLEECEIVKNWEEELYSNHKIETRTISQFEHKNPNFNFSWIYNWCIWKNYWQIYYKNFEKNDELEKQISNLKKILKNNEYIHLKLLSMKTNFEENKKEYLIETKLFTFYHLKEN